MACSGIDLGNLLLLFSQTHYPYIHITTSIAHSAYLHVLLVLLCRNFQLRDLIQSVDQQNSKDWLMVCVILFEIITFYGIDFKY